jgi:hypothetical protein
MQIIKDAYASGYQGRVYELIDQATIQRASQIENQTSEELPEAPIPALGGRMPSTPELTSTERNIIQPGQYETGGKKKEGGTAAEALSSRKYEKLLDKLGGNPESDTLVSGSSIDQATAIKKAKFNYNQATNVPFTDQITKYNKKTGKYTTYFSGPKQELKKGGYKSISPNKYENGGTDPKTDPKKETTVYTRDGVQFPSYKAYEEHVKKGLETYGGYKSVDDGFYTEGSGGAMIGSSGKPINVLLDEHNVEGKLSFGQKLKKNANFIGHTILDVVGAVPIIGEPVDLVNAAWYAAEGKYTDASLTAASAIPFFGWGATSLKWGKKGAGEVYTGMDKALRKNLKTNSNKLLKDAGYTRKQRKDIYKNKPEVINDLIKQDAISKNVDLDNVYIPGFKVPPSQKQIDKMTSEIVDAEDVYHNAWMSRENQRMIDNTFNTYDANLVRTSFWQNTGRHTGDITNRTYLASPNKNMPGLGGFSTVHKGGYSMKHNPSNPLNTPGMSRSHRFNTFKTNIDGAEFTILPSERKRLGLDLGQTYKVPGDPTLYPFSGKISNVDPRNTTLIPKYDPITRTFDKTNLVPSNNIWPRQTVINTQNPKSVFSTTIHEDTHKIYNTNRGFVNEFTHEGQKKFINIQDPEGIGIKGVYGQGTMSGDFTNPLSSSLREGTLGSTYKVVDGKYVPDKQGFWKKNPTSGQFEIETFDDLITDTIIGTPTFVPPKKGFLDRLSPMLSGYNRKLLKEKSIFNKLNPDIGSNGLSVSTLKKQEKYGAKLVNTPTSGHRNYLDYLDRPYEKHARLNEARFFPGLSQFNLKPGSTHSIGDYDKMLNILRKSKNPIGFQLRDASTLKRLHETVPYKGGGKHKNVI